MIASNRFCVLATVADGAPHCSLMSYISSDDCRELYMATQKNTKKYANLINNPTVSLLIDSRHSEGRVRALTITGSCLQALPAEKKLGLRRQLIDRHPDLKVLLDDEKTDIVAVRVRALQLLDGVLDTYYEEVP